DRSRRDQLAVSRPRGRRARRRPCRQQHDQRLLRPRGRGRHRRLRPGPVRAASEPVGLGHEEPARGCDPPRQCDRPGDHVVPDGRPRPARDRAGVLMIGFYPIVLGAVLVGWIGPWVALVVLGIPRLLEILKTFAASRPETPPHSYVGWPLWFVGAAFIHTRRAGGLLVLGLLLNAFLPIRLPWL